MGDQTRGLYEKFHVQRTDGKSAPGEKHHGCQYFVLDCDHDPHARAALNAYAASCKDDFPRLAADVRALLYGCAFGGTPTAELGRPAVETSAALPAGECDHKWVADPIRPFVRDCSYCGATRVLNRGEQL